jgi:hypothetical protein
MSPADGHRAADRTMLAGGHEARCDWHIAEGTGDRNDLIVTVEPETLPPALVRRTAVTRPGGKLSSVGGVAVAAPGSGCDGSSRASLPRSVACNGPLCYGGLKTVMYFGSHEALIKASLLANRHRVDTSETPCAWTINSVAALEQSCPPSRNATCRLFRTGYDATRDHTQANPTTRSWCPADRSLVGPAQDLCEPDGTCVRPPVAARAAVP